MFRSLREVAALYDFPVTVCDDQNSSGSIARLQEWSPDLMIFAGGNILRKQFLESPPWRPQCPPRTATGGSRNE